MALGRYIYCFLLAVLTITCKREVGFDPQPPLQYGTYYWGEVNGQRNKVPMRDCSLNCVRPEGE